MFENVSDDGLYDFGSWARDLLSAIRSKSKAEKTTIIKKLEENNTTTKTPYFWDAVVEQLRHSGHLKVIYVPIDDAKKEAALELTEIGKKYVRSRKSELKLKAIGLMYAFFTKKCQTPAPSTKRSTKSVHKVKSENDSKWNVFLSEPKPWVQVDDIDAFYGNRYDDYDPEQDEETSSEDEESDDEENDDEPWVQVSINIDIENDYEESDDDDNDVAQVTFNDSDVIWVENTDDPETTIIVISDDENDEP